ncbi:hypothetical protein GE09DRAFT_1110811 [Coniochaeta sp. 2T2.1]|nr:hypothetical protein GE09DRAFT_1110811 [Coniochaeta sp. 2T2.1]
MTMRTEAILYGRVPGFSTLRGKLVRCFALCSQSPVAFKDVSVPEGLNTTTGESQVCTFLNLHHSLLPTGSCCFCRVLVPFGGSRAHSNPGQSGKQTEVLVSLNSTPCSLLLYNFKFTLTLSSSSSALSGPLKLAAGPTSTLLTSRFRGLRSPGAFQVASSFSRQILHPPHCFLPYLFLAHQSFDLKPSTSKSFSQDLETSFLRSVTSFPFPHHL